MANWQAGIIFAAAILALWALFAGGAWLVRLVTKRETPQRLTGSPDAYPSRDMSRGRGRWPDDTGR
jgi:hypothetical protein